MSADLVAAAAANRGAFDPMPLPESLANCHVPFAHLTGDDVEGRISDHLSAYGRIALVGPIGCGKSSVARYALKRADNLAPIWINVATEDHTRIATVRGFLEILVSQIMSRANAAQRLSESRRREILSAAQRTEPLGRVDMTTRAELGGSYWLLKGGVAREITRSLDQGEAYRATDDLRRAAHEAIRSIADADLVPVLVADDTDRLLNIAGEPEQRQRLFEGFFGDVLREIADHLECGLLLATHDRYRDEPDYDTMTSGLVDHVHVPVLERPEQIGAVITARLEFVDEHAAWQQLIAPEAVQLLLELYHANNRSLRKTLTELREALGFASSEAADLIELRHVESAAAN